MTAPSELIEYTELKVTLRAEAGGTFGVDATSPQGEASGTFELPFTVEELPEKLRQLSTAVLPKLADLPLLTRESESEFDQAAPTISPRAFGVTLYKALFRGDIEKLLFLTLGSISQQPNAGLRIRLHFSTKADEMSHVLSLPWELLAPSETEDPIAASRSRALVRALPVLKPASPPSPVQQTLKVLVIISSPRGEPALNLEEEKSKLQREWAGFPGIDVIWTRGVFENIRQLLIRDDPHVIHFMGHGDFRDGRGVLLFETEQGDVDRIDGEEFGRLLSEERALRLVFLNACRTAQTGAVRGTDPFAGVATALVRSGVTAVLAMQFPVSDQTAIVFSRCFYQGIIAGLPVDGAVGEARSYVLSPKHAEWATPVLFMRSDNGVLFDRSQRPTATPAVSVSGPTSATTDGFTVFLAETSDAMRKWTRQAKKELQAKGCTIVEAEATAADEHKAHVRALADSADLFVHVFGDAPGEVIDGDPAKSTYPMEQFRIGHAAARAQMVFLPVGLTPSAVADAAYGQFLQEIEARPRDAARLEFVTTDQQQMVAEILRKKQELQQPGAASRKQRVYLDLHPKDEASREMLRTLLSARGIAVADVVNIDAAGAGALEAYEDALRRVAAVFVVAGAGEPAWISNRVQTAFKAAMAANPPAMVGLLRLPGGAPEPVLPIPLPVVGDGTVIADADLDAFLSKAAGRLA
jgi:hypothetical protein